MRRKILVMFSLLIITGYILDYGFKAMNLDSDAGYVGGMVGIIVWACFLPILWKALTKERKKNAKESVGNVSSIDGDYESVGVYKNRPGERGN